MVAAKIKVVDPVDMVELWVEAEVEVVEARCNREVRGRLEFTLLPFAVSFIMRFIINTIVRSCSSKP